MKKNVDPCADVCPVQVPATPAKGAGPSPRSSHLPSGTNPLTRNTYREDYLAWVRLPNAPYPPGGTPSGGAQELSISSEEWARLAALSPCRRCELAQEIKKASRVWPRIRKNWMFWAGVGAGTVGLGMLVVMKR